MPVRCARRQALAQSVHVQPGLVLGRPPGRLAVERKPRVAQRTVEQRQSAPYLGAGTALVQLGPEQGRQRVAAVAARAQRQVGQHGYGLFRD